MSNRYQWWGTPRKFTEQIKNRKVSWLELFSDLMFVIIFHSLISNAIIIEKPMTFFNFIILFFLIIDIWNNLTMYFDLHASQSMRTTVFTLVQSMGVAILSVCVKSALNGDYMRFIIVYLIIQIFVTYTWGSVVFYDPQHFGTTKVYLIGASIQIALLVACLFIPSTFVQSGLLVVIILVKNGTLSFNQGNLDREFKQRKIQMEISDSFQERYGELTMILLGEAIADIVELAENKLTWQHLVTIILMTLTIIGIWWIYYAIMDDVHVTGKHYRRLLVFRGLHNAFIFCLVLVTFFLIQLDESSVSMNVIKLGYALTFIGAVALMYGMRTYASITKEWRSLYLWCLLIVVVAGVIGYQFSGLTMAAIMAVSLALNVVLLERKLYLETN